MGSTCYFYDGMLNIKKLDLNKIKIDEYSYKFFLICLIGYVTIKHFRCITIICPKG